MGWSSQGQVTLVVSAGAIVDLKSVPRLVGPIEVSATIKNTSHGVLYLRAIFGEASNPWG